MPAAPTKAFPRRGTSTVQARTPATTQAATATTRLILVDFTSSASCLIDPGLEPVGPFPCTEIMTILRIALSALVTIVVAGCSTGPAAATHPTTCADWRSMSETAQTELATAIVDANDLLQALRVGQHEGPPGSQV